MVRTLLTPKFDFESVGDLSRRKSGKEAREIKVEKVKIGKNGKGRY